MTYNKAGRLLTVKATKGTTTYTSFSYGYTSGGVATGLVTSATDLAGNSTTYTYGALNHLRTATVTGPQAQTYNYSYDAAGNMTKKTIGGTATNLCYNAASELTGTYGSTGSCTSPTTTYSYDANGNWTGRSDGLSLIYNAQNQATSVGGTSMSYSGPGMAERVTAGSSSYQYDGTGMSQISDTSTSTQLTTLPDGSVLSETIGGSTYYPLHDGNGSVVGLTDSSTTPVLSDQCFYDSQGNAYDPAGASGHPCTQPAIANRFLWLGMERDSSTGLYGLYDPITGKPLSGERPGCKDRGWLEPTQKPAVFNEDRCGEDEFSSGVTCSAAYQCVNFEVAPTSAGNLKAYFVIQSFAGVDVGLNYNVQVAFANNSGQVIRTRTVEGHPKFVHTQGFIYTYTAFTIPISSIPCGGGVEINVAAFSEQLVGGYTESPFSFKPVRIARRCST